jgi:hypothetical protein
MAAACRLIPELMANEGSRTSVAGAEAIVDGLKASPRPGN